MLDHIHITGVHVHKGALLLVVGLPPLEAGLQQGDGVGELLSAGRVGFIVHTLGLGLLEVAIVALLQLFL